MASNRAAIARRARGQAQVEPPPGWRVIPFGASDMTECGCRVGVFVGVPCVPIAWTRNGATYEIICLVCGKRWTRARPAHVASGGLCIDGTHPEERAARAARKARR